MQGTTKYENGSNFMCNAIRLIKLFITIFKHNLMSL